MKKSNVLFVAIFVSLMVLSIITIPVMAEETGSSPSATTSPKIWTDKADYSPEETVWIYGTGFFPNSLITVNVTRPDGHMDSSLDEEDNIVYKVTIVYTEDGKTDDNGNFTATYKLNGILGEYTIAATDGYGNRATTTFNDTPKVGSVTVSAQYPDPVIAGNNATYTITVRRGSGQGSSGTFTANLSITTTLPSGTAAYFDPNSVKFEPNDDVKNVTLNITTNSSTPAGSFSFTVKAYTSQHDYATGNGTLKVIKPNSPPVLTLPSLPSSIDEMEEWNFTATASDPDIPVNTLTFSLENAPPGASIDPSTGYFTWTPSEEQGPGTYKFNVTVSDGSLTDYEEITVHVNEVNRPPVLGPIGDKTVDEETLLTFTATASDPDIPVNTLTFSLENAPPGASIDPSTGYFTWTPTSSQIGPHTFKVKVADSGTPALFDEEEITVTVNKRPTTITYSGDTSSQYSDNATLIATLRDTNGTALGSKLITFTINGLSTNAYTNDSGIAVGYIILDKIPGTYTVDASFSGDDYYLPCSADETFTINKENAKIFYTGALFVSTASTTSGKAAVTLAVTVQDVTAYDASDPYAGNISKAKVSFYNDTDLIASVPIILVDPSNTTTGTATYIWYVDIGSSASQDYTIKINVNDYYDATEFVVVTVSKPLSTNFITGGGYIILSSSAGQYAGDPGTHANFGFNVKYNKGGKNLQGNVNIIFRRTVDGELKVYQIKGNALTSLQVDVNNGSATFFCKANLKDITDPFNPITIAGNGLLKLTMVDKGEPGKSDTIGITYWDNDGRLRFSSNWNGAMTIEQVLTGGNLVVH